mgnify:FL=1
MPVDVLELLLYFVKLSLLEVWQEHVVRQPVLGHVEDNVPKQLRILMPDVFHFKVEDLFVLGVDDILNFVENLFGRQEVDFAELVARLSIRSVGAREAAQSDLQKRNGDVSFAEDALGLRIQFKVGCKFDVLKALLEFGLEQLRSALGMLAVLSQLHHDRVVLDDHVFELQLVHQRALHVEVHLVANLLVEFCPHYYN